MGWGDLVGEERGDNVMSRCPKCGQTCSINMMWANPSHTMSHHEYICPCCGCHWVERYELIKKDIIKEGKTNAKMS